MRIGILGAGRMGTTLARLFRKARHQVKLANSRDPKTLAALVAELGDGVSAGTPAEVAAFGDVVVLATRWEQIANALAAAGPLQGKILIDTTNPRYGPAPGDVYDIGERSSGEVVASLAVGATVVKAFNHAPITALAALASEERRSESAFFLSGDDAAAKACVSELIRDIGGHPFDIGSLAQGVLQDTGHPLAGHGRLLSVSEARRLLRG